MNVVTAKVDHLRIFMLNQIRLKKCVGIPLFLRKLNRRGALEVLNNACNSMKQKDKLLANDWINLSRIKKMDAFQLFELEYSFSINKPVLDSKYRELIKRFHPDTNNVHVSIPIHINKQYNILNDPFERALLFLSITHDITKAELVEIMDSLPINETILDYIFDISEKVKTNFVNSTYSKGLDDLIEQNNSRIDNCIFRLEQEFCKDDPSMTGILSILKELRMYQKVSFEASNIR
ncbi:Fe-S protein assembly co-chaperone HscB [Cryptosporidium felis]|nr:Fe-S protein assembly co-chaperone HscB [Cryptosporidium felis]